MFTGIIESLGTVTDIIKTGTNKSFRIKSPLSDSFTIDQSISHNGVCLTVESVKNGEHQVTAIAETLSKTNLGNWKTGDLINIERCLQLHARIDGHLVQGHIDTTATCVHIKEMNGSKEFTFQFDPSFAGLVIEKGSISLNGISLTIFNVTQNSFTVAIIPYTLEHTNLQQLKLSDTVNIEFDMMGKYVARMLELKEKSNPPSYV